MEEIIIEVTQTQYYNVISKFAGRLFHGKTNDGKFLIKPLLTSIETIKRHISTL